MTSFIAHIKEIILRTAQVSIKRLNLILFAKKEMSLDETAQTLNRTEL